MEPSLVALVGSEYEENLSLRYLASSIEAEGFRARIVPANRLDPAFAAEADGGAFGALVEDILDGAERRPIVVGISVPFQLHAAELLQLAVALRARGFAGHICVGGHFATFEYEN